MPKGIGVHVEDEGEGMIYKTNSILRELLIVNELKIW